MATFQRLKLMSLNTGFTHPHATARRQIPTSSNLFASSFFHLTPGLPVYLEVGWCWMSGPTMLWSHFLPAFRPSPWLGHAPAHSVVQSPGVSAGAKGLVNGRRSPGRLSQVELRKGCLGAKQRGIMIIMEFSCIICTCAISQPLQVLEPTWAKDNKTTLARLATRHLPNWMTLVTWTTSEMKPVGICFPLLSWDRFKRSFILLPSKRAKKFIMTFQVEPTSWTHQISSTRDGSHLRFGGHSELLNLYEFRKNDLDLSRWSKWNECIRPKKELGFLCDKWSMPKELRQIPSCTPCQFAEARLMPWLLPLTFQCGCHEPSTWHFPPGASRAHTKRHLLAAANTSPPVAGGEFRSWSTGPSKLNMESWNSLEQYIG